MLAVLLLSFDVGGNLYVEGELCVSGLTLGEAAEAIVKFLCDVRVEYAVASPDLWNRRQDSGRSGLEIMQGVRGMPPLIAADDRRIPGWRVLREYLSLREGKPSLYVSRRCEMLIHSLQSLLCDKTRFEDASSEPHTLTHAPEALRYAVMSRFSMKHEDEIDRNFTFLNKKSEIRSFLDC
jgi:phage terminase large subunit